MDKTLGQIAHEAAESQFRGTTGWARIGGAEHSQWEAIAAVVAAAVKEEWQPIETAPKDAYVLVFPPTWSGKTASIARWNDDRYSKKPRPFWDRDDDLGRAAISREKITTHWMPLPEAPK